MKAERETCNMRPLPVSVFIYTSIFIFPKIPFIATLSFLVIKVETKCKNEKYTESLLYDPIFPIGFVKLTYFLNLKINIFGIREGYFGNFGDKQNKHIWIALYK